LEVGSGNAEGGKARKQGGWEAGRLEAEMIEDRKVN